MRQLARGPGAPAPPSALGAAPMPAKPQFLVTASDTATGTSQRRDALSLRLDRRSSFDFSRGELRAPRHCVERPEASVSRHDEGYGREPLPVDGRPDGPAREEGRGLEAGGDVLFQARSVRASSLILLRLVARVQPPPRALDGARWPDDLSPRLTPRPGVCRPAQQDRHDAHHGGESASVFCAVGLSSAPCSAPRSLLPASTLRPTCACSIISHAAPLRPSSTTTSSGWGA